MSERGKYIVIEGSDGTGKSLQAIETSRHLTELGYESLLVWNDETGQMEPVQEPGGTPRANIIRKRIKDKNIPRTPWDNVKWFTQARESIWDEAIEPALESGIWVVTARSWISTVAY
jgi:dTMP kinase